jgi:hypothetical protein
MMLIVAKSMKLISTRMEDIYYLAVKIPLWKYGI